MFTLLTLQEKKSFEMAQNHFFNKDFEYEKNYSISIYSSQSSPFENCLSLNFMGYLKEKNGMADWMVGRAAKGRD